MKATDRGPADAAAGRGVQSIETGGALLRVLVARREPMMLKDLAAGAGMAAAKAHRYLVSLMRLGLVERDPASGRYDLGPFALHLGLAAMAQVDAMRIATPLLGDLAHTLGATVALAVLGNRGPTFVRREESADTVIVSLRAGAVMPLLTSATGLCFMAWLEPARSAELLEQELALAAGSSRTSIAAARTALSRTLTTTRRQGMTRVRGTLIPGIDALSVPVFDHRGSMALALTALGCTGKFDSGFDGLPAARLAAAAKALSARLGAA